MKRYRLAVCKGSQCRGAGSTAVFSTAQTAVVQLGLAGRCEVARGGCYGLCHLGPNVVIRENTGAPKDPFSREDYQLTGVPGETFYGAMTSEKVMQVVAEHIGLDRPVQALATRPSATDKTTSTLGGTATHSG